jgi:catechol 2,3-dioxygenase-like lactoylglutathione lyase family enzyme
MYISVVSIPVSDQDRSRDFYADGLGFEVISDGPFGEGQRWLQLAPPGAQTSITLVTWLDDLRPGTVRGLILDVDDIGAERGAMEGRGVRFTADTFDTPWGSFAAFEDPDGNRWSLHQNA